MRYIFFWLLSTLKKQQMLTDVLYEYTWPWPTFWKCFNLMFWGVFSPWLILALKTLTMVSLHKTSPSLSWNWSGTSHIHSHLRCYRTYRTNCKKAGVGFIWRLIQEHLGEPIQNSQDGCNHILSFSDWLFARLMLFLMKTETMRWLSKSTSVNPDAICIITVKGNTNWLTKL